ncbi:MAG TPA: hypothetical protein VGD67_10375 [Pseudonocardiaceae bacterium]
MDRTQGRRLVDGLRAAGLDVTTFADVWGDHAARRSDVDWIRWAAAHRRVALTADESIGYLEAKRHAILASRLQVLCFPQGGLPVAERLRRVLALAGAIDRLATRRPGPWLATLYDDRLIVTWPTREQRPGPGAAGLPPEPRPDTTPEQPPEPSGP